MKGGDAMNRYTGKNLTYGELRELVKDRDADEDVVVLRIAEDNYDYRLEKFLIDGDLVLC